ncbi:MAG: TatD family hydrolase [Myxococcota bacterium]|nr:TatD family hydrolase [Myxococcota bacterium]
MHNPSSEKAQSLFDICINFDNEQFNPDREAILSRAKDAGVRYINFTGSSVESSTYASEWASKDPSHYCSTAGIHPHDAKRFDEKTIETLRTLLQNPWVRAVGECGLDYNRNFSPKEDQLHCFTAHIELAHELNMPLFLHQRDAHEDFVACMKENQQPAVVHCFTDTRSALKQYLDLGYFIGITGWICDPKRGETLRSNVSYIPLDRILIETDAPWLLPKDMRPKPKKRRNEPAYLPHILDIIAKHMGRNTAEVAAASTKNALTFFGMPSCSSHP